MYDDEPVGHDFTSPWFFPETKPSNEEGYFSPYYPVDETLVTPAIQETAQQSDNSHSI